MSSYLINRLTKIKQSNENRIIRMKFKDIHGIVVSWSQQVIYLQEIVKYL